MDAKRVKRLIYGKSHKALVLSEPGLDETTNREVARLLAAPVQPLDDAPQVSNTDDGILLSYVSFRRVLELAQRLQTAADIFWVLEEKRVASPSELKKAMSALPWELYLPQGAKVRVFADSRGSRLYHEGLMRETGEEVLREKGFAPQREQGARIKLLLRENRLVIALGLFEEPLYKRGNKAALKATAPLKETLAAGLCQRTATWLQAHKRTIAPHVYVPFAGSGTLGLEALAFHADFSWQAFFQTLALAGAPCFPEESVAFIRRRLRERAQEAAPLAVSFVDYHEETIGVLEKTVEKVSSFLPSRIVITTHQGDFFTHPLPREPFFVPLHPPYGERLGVSDVAGLYARIAARLNEAERVTGFILVPDEGAWSVFLKNLRGFTHETWHVMQGGKDVRVVAFFKGLP